MAAGGSVRELDLLDGSQGEIDGGSISGEVVVFHDARALVSSGGLTSAFVVHGGSFDLRGGSANEIGVEGIGTLEMRSGASLSSLVPAGFADVLVTGGTLSFGLFTDDFARTRLFGGTVTGTLEASGRSRTDLFGSNFTLDGAPVSGALTASSGNLAGDLAIGGGAIDVTLLRNPDAVVFLPEPSSSALTAFALCACAALARSPRKREP